MRRLTALLVVVLALALMAVGCGSSGPATTTSAAAAPTTPTTAATTTTTQVPTTTTMATTTTTMAATTTSIDIKARITSLAKTVTWDELMAGVPEQTFLKVSGTIEQDSPSDTGGSLLFDGNDAYVLTLDLMPDVNKGLGLPSLSMAELKAARQVTLYGVTIMKTAGVDLGDGGGIVQGFIPLFIEDGANSGAGQTGTTGAGSQSYSDGVYFVGTHIPAGTYKGVTNGDSGKCAKEVCRIDMSARSMGRAILMLKGEG